MAKAKSTKNEVVVDIFDEIEVAQGAQEAVDIWGSEYLPIQWQNPLGLWEAPLQYWAGSMLELSTEVSQVQHGANMVSSFLLKSISIAPFAPPKVHWGYRDAEGKYIMAKERMDSVNPWRSRVHILCLMKEAESMTPVILTAGSNTGKHLLANVSAGQLRIKNMLKKIGRPAVLPCFFWMEMVKGVPVKVGEGEESSTICPPTAPPPKNIHKMKPPQIAKHLTDIYVGQDIRDLFNDGLLAEGQEWFVKQPERLRLGDGNGGDSAALLPVLTKAAVSDDGTLFIPDLSESKPPTMIDCGISIPGLFDHRNHAANAFAKMLTQKRLGSASDAVKWEAWKQELEARWAHKISLDADIALEAELRAPAMDEVEADAEIPPAFR